MSFVDSIKTVLIQKYCCFEGRARRSEYWWFCLFNVIVSSVLSAIHPYLGYAYALAVLLPGLGVAVRRLHDTGRSGWLVLLALIPLVGGIIVLVFMCQDSQPDNQYGASPKYSNNAPGGYSPY